MNRHRIFTMIDAGRVLTAAVALTILLAHHASGEDKQYGWDGSKVNRGKGGSFDAPEKDKLNKAIGMLDTLGTITIKGGLKYTAKDIATDLKEMIKDGRMGKG